jgi:hypothetical protein
MAAPVFLFDAEELIGISEVGYGEKGNFRFIIVIGHEAMMPLLRILGRRKELLFRAKCFLVNVERECQLP